MVNVFIYRKIALISKPKDLFDLISVLESNGKHSL